MFSCCFDAPQTPTTSILVLDPKRYVAKFQNGISTFVPRTAKTSKVEKWIGKKSKTELIFIEEHYSRKETNQIYDQYCDRQEYVNEPDMYLLIDNNNNNNKTVLRVTQNMSQESLTVCLYDKTGHIKKILCIKINKNTRDIDIMTQILDFFEYYTYEFWTRKQLAPDNSVTFCTN